MCEDGLAEQQPRKSAGVRWQGTRHAPRGSLDSTLKEVGVRSRDLHSYVSQVLSVSMGDLVVLKKILHRQFCDLAGFYLAI